jgi:hypothetical protein
MPTQVPDTPNHDLPKIPPLDAAYADEWGFILNNGEFADGTDAGADSLIDALEQRVPIVSDESARSNFTPYSTAAFFSADTGRIYVGDGTNWIRLQDPDKLDASTYQPVADVNGSSISPSSVSTDSASVTNTVSAGTVSADAVTAADELGNPTYATLSDVPTNLPEGTQVYVKDENAIYVEDGT